MRWQLRDRHDRMRGMFPDPELAAHVRARYADDTQDQLDIVPAAPPAAPVRNPALLSDLLPTDDVLVQHVEWAEMAHLPGRDRRTAACGAVTEFRLAAGRMASLLGSLCPDCVQGRCGQ